MSEIDLSFRVAGPSEAQPKGPARLAIAAALLLHAGIALWFLVDWHKMPAPAPDAPPIVATLVREPPPAPAPPPPPKPPEPNLAERSSGPGEKTTALPPAQEVAPEPEAPKPTEAESPALPAPQSAQATEPAAPPVEEKPKRPTPPRTEPRKEEFAMRAPLLAPRLDERALGDKEETGDPYLNMIWARIERNRERTTPIGSSGLHLEGISVYALRLDHDGHLQGLALLESSGSPLLDGEARRMIVAATPFPPPPADYTDHTTIRVTIRLFPQ